MVTQVALKKYTLTASDLSTEESVLLGVKPG